MRLKRPREPTAGECCGSGCARCVWDVYYDQLSAYEEERARLKEAGDLSETDEEESDDGDTSSTSSEGISDYIGSVVVKMLDSSASPKNSNEAVRDALTGGQLYPIVRAELKRCSVPDPSVDDGTEPICVLDLDTPKLKDPPCPGDIVEILAPNNTMAGEDLVASVCERLQVDPESVCELHRSPFVPEDHFPPWLPLRQPLTVRALLTYFVDLSSCSYLLRPVFFQSLLRIFNNRNRGHQATPNATQQEGSGTVELLRACADETTGPQLFRTILNKDQPLCYPCLVDVLNVFPFVQLPLDRLLEISGPLQLRKFSVAGFTAGPTHESDTVQLCIRRITKRRDEHQPSLLASDGDNTCRELVALLNGAAARRHSKGDSSAWFRGHTSVPLVQQAMSATNAALPVRTGLVPPQLYLGTAQFGSSTFATELRNALVTVSRVPNRCGPLILVGAGTGIAPLVAAVKELLHRRQLAPGGADPFACWVFYGARSRHELVYHDTISDAHSAGAVSRYEHALSRETDSPTLHKNVVDVMKANDSVIREGLTSGNGQIFVCGPAAVLRAVRQFIGSTLLGETDDDDSIREQRVLLLEEKQQLFFDMWSTVNIFD